MMLVGNPDACAGVVALHAVVAAELGIARGFILLTREIAISRRESVGTMRARHPAELPEGFLDAFRERGEALTAADRFDVLPTTEGQPKMVEQMAERLAVKSNAEAIAVGEVRERLKAGRCGPLGGRSADS